MILAVVGFVVVTVLFVCFDAATLVFWVEPVVFFFQAEDGIRDSIVTGVQTCALPICILKAIREPLCTATVVHSGSRIALRIPAQRAWRSSFRSNSATSGPVSTRIIARAFF